MRATMTERQQNEEVFQTWWLDNPKDEHCKKNSTVNGQCITYIEFNYGDRLQMNRKYNMYVTRIHTVVTPGDYHYIL